MSLTFQYPQLLVLFLLLPLLVRYLTNRRLTPSTALRVAIAVLAIAALTRPRVETDDRGSDLILLVDRSASAGAAAERMLREILPILRGQAGTGDRLAVVGFGNGAVVERGFAGDPAGTQLPDGFSLASDLAGGLRIASGLRDPARRSAVLCLSDGLYTGDEPVAAAVASGLESVPFWYRRLGGGGGLDVAAGGIHVPDLVQPRSAWLVRYALLANAPVRADYVLSRNGLVIDRGEVDLRRGENHFFMRDSAPEAEIIEYRLEVRADGDVQNGNNASSALVRVGGAPRVLVVSYLSEPGLLASSLAAAAIPVDSIRPEDFPASPAQLAPYKLVVLENCQLSSISARGVRSLAETLRSGVCSVLVTGGPNSFGMGGYHRSALDPLLPVEMELRNDTRRTSMAVAMTLDRSGSMAAPAGWGATKMDLANLGAAEAIRLLSPTDQVSVIAVDSSAHLIIPLSVADEVETLAKTTQTIQSMGGGIFCRTALEAAALEMRKSSLRNRHIILFADASDAEEQEGCIDLARELVAEGICLSVVAMGDTTDPDADFLIELAREGGGEALFSNEASGLPALFTQEIMRISRRGFLEEEVTPLPLPSMSLLGVTPADPRPVLGGYNIGAARDGAVVYMRLDDEFHTPMLATRSLGRATSGAILFEVEGEFSGNFPRWTTTPELIVALARRLAPGGTPAGIKAYSSVSGDRGEVTLEFSPEAARTTRGLGAAPKVRWLGVAGEALESEVEWLGPETARSRVRLVAPGHYLPLFDIPGVGLLNAPALSLPYSPEYTLRGAAEGLAVLRGLAEFTGGGDGLDLAQVRQSARSVRARAREISAPLLVLALALFLVELSGRRLLWFS